MNEPVLVTLDTCVLADLESGGDEEFFQKLEVVNRLRAHLRQGTIQLVLDVEGGIISEYETVLVPNSLGRRFHSSCVTASYYHYASSRPTRKCGVCLEELGFDPSDRKFIGLLQPGGYYVTSEVKHLVNEIRSKIATCCDVRILSMLELDDLLRFL